MYKDRENPEYYAKRIFFMISMLKKYCMSYEDIYEIDIMYPAIEYLSNLSDKLYCYYLDIKD